MIARVLLISILALSLISRSLEATEVNWAVYLRRAGPIRIGMSLEQVRRILADPTAYLEGNEPDVPLRECAYLHSKTLPEDPRLMFADKVDSQYGMVFETDNGIVTSFRVGTLAAIALVEGCS